MCGFQGTVPLGHGHYCYPLTVTDHYSRYILGCEGLTGTDRLGAQPIFESLFDRYGLPQALRTDNGPPFASRGLGGLSRLSVWWLKLGIAPSASSPASPNRTGAMSGCT